MKDEMEGNKGYEAAESGQKQRENPKFVTLFVNGRQREWPEHKKISFREVVVLAYGTFENAPTIEYTVTYSNGPRQNRQGIMVHGDEVKVQEGMNFNATRTDKS